jgi:hypothetical protein
VWIWEDMATGFGEDSNLTRDGSHQRLGRIVEERSCRERTEWPTEDTPKGCTHVVAVCATPGQLDYFTALLFQQHGKQPTLRKGRR